MWGHRKRKPSAREPSPGEKWTSTLILDSRTVRNNACCISYPDACIFLQQPKLTETAALSLLPRIVLGGWWHSHKCCLLKPPHSPLGRAYIPIRRHSVSRTEMMVSSTKLQSSPGVPVPLCTHVQATSQDWLCHPMWHDASVSPTRLGALPGMSGNSRVMSPEVIWAAWFSWVFPVTEQTRKGDHFAGCV